MRALYVAILAGFSFQQAQAYDLPKQPIKSYECNACDKLSRDTLSDKWEIDGELTDTAPSNAQKSYGYKQKVTMEQLRKGVAITTLAPGAVLRIVPLQKNAEPTFELVTPGKKHFSLQEASSLYSENETLGDSSLAVKQQKMLQIKPELGAGTFLLQTEDRTAKNNDTYLISVLDKLSLSYIRVETDALRYQFGDMMTATISLNKDDGPYKTSDLSVYLVSPRGEMTPLTLTDVGHSRFEARAPLISETSDQGENWYVEADAITKLGSSVVRRSGHTGFSYYIPSGTLLSAKKVSNNPLTISVSVEVATASRYVLQSVLYKKTNDDNLEALETAQVAQWLEPGVHEMQFTFDNLQKLADDNLLLGYLHLTDYGQLKTVYEYNPPVRLTKLVDK